MSIDCCFTYLLILVVVTEAWVLKAQPVGDNATVARQLDALLQDYGYRGFGFVRPRPRTGEVYPADAPANLSGIKLSVIRLRSGSLRHWGVRNFNEFDIPAGVIVSPYVVRLALVYQNLGNWSSQYYSVPGYIFVTPVIGLLAYNAANLSATNLPELSINSYLSPISIRFSNRSLISGGQLGKCVFFNLNGSYEFDELVSGNLCMTRRQGHFSVAVKVSIVEGQEKKTYNVWKIAVGVVSGVVALTLILLLTLLLQRYRKNKNMKDMVNHSEMGEVLNARRVGDARLPVAPMIRTKPVLENEYAP